MMNQYENDCFVDQKHENGPENVIEDLSEVRRGQSFFPVGFGTDSTQHLCTALLIETKSKTKDPRPFIGTDRYTVNPCTALKPTVKETIGYYLPTGDNTRHGDYTHTGVQTLTGLQTLTGASIQTGDKTFTGRKTFIGQMTVTDPTPAQQPTVKETIGSYLCIPTGDNTHTGDHTRHGDHTPTGAQTLTGASMQTGDKTFIGGKTFIGQMTITDPTPVITKFFPHFSHPPYAHW
jgi:hypothetical protein